MEKVNIPGLTEKCMLVSGTKIQCMDMGSMNGLMDGRMKGNIWTT